MLKKAVQIFLLIFFTTAFCAAEEENTGFFEGILQHAAFGKPFWADMHSTLFRLEAAYASNSPDYDWGDTGDSYRPFVYINFGLDIPIWSGNFATRKYGLSITLPLTLDIWYDRFEEETSPVINVSYRFSAFDAAFIYRLDNSPQVFPGFYIFNWGLRLSLFKHESTHIGDELTIHRKNNEKFDIARIDARTNFLEMIFILNDPDGQSRLNHGFKFGFIFNYSDGWYAAFESEVTDTDLVGSSRFPFEIFTQYQFQSPLFSIGFQFIVSAEYRLREQFNYPYYNDKKDLVLGKENVLAHCFNLFTGIRYDNQKNSFFSKIGVGLRYYYGINPYGQFRSMPDYHQFGLVAIFE